MSIDELYSEFEELIDKALNELSSKDFKTFIEHLDQIIVIKLLRNIKDYKKREVTE